ncbi:SRPBCC family protein [Mycobacterium sp. Y57]|uniref:SRPBCC family protein n=1 Tax=Mycolicibacterium xanthum TaxID=2796469 RepID=UPI001C858D33|nr:SRPBCC family protein [Mycolicibacterium xanthum]MBX7433355.1 SRPBCC family protein [Mycolicibacterium xanthum]
MVEVSRSRTVDAGPEAIWAVLADFGSLSEWADDIDHSSLLHETDPAHPIGTTRRIQVGRDTLLETIVEFDPPHSLAYDITGLPRRVSASNRWTLHPDAGGRTTVTLTSTVAVAAGPIGPIAERAVARLMAKRSDGLLTSLSSTPGGTTG